jgi:hypothetical protein
MAFHGLMSAGGMRATAMYDVRGRVTPANAAVGPVLRRFGMTPFAPLIARGAASRQSKLRSTRPGSESTDRLIRGAAVSLSLLMSRFMVNSEN